MCRSFNSHWIYILTRNATNKIFAATKCFSFTVNVRFPLLRWRYISHFETNASFGFGMNFYFFYCFTSSLSQFYVSVLCILCDQHQGGTRNIQHKKWYTTLRTNIWSQTVSFCRNDEDCLLWYLILWCCYHTNLQTRFSTARGKCWRALAKSKLSVRISLFAVSVAAAVAATAAVSNRNSISQAYCKSTVDESTRQCVVSSPGSLYQCESMDNVWKRAKGAQRPKENIFVRSILHSIHVVLLPCLLLLLLLLLMMVLLPLLRTISAERLPSVFIHIQCSLSRSSSFRVLSVALLTKFRRFPNQLVFYVYLSSASRIERRNWWFCVENTILTHSLYHRESPVKCVCVPFECVPTIHRVCGRQAFWSCNLYMDTLFACNTCDMRITYRVHTISLLLISPYTAAAIAAATIVQKYYCCDCEIAKYSHSAFAPFGSHTLVHSSHHCWTISNGIWKGRERKKRKKPMKEKWCRAYFTSSSCFAWCWYSIPHSLSRSVSLAFIYRLCVFVASMARTVYSFFRIYVDVGQCREQFASLPISTISVLQSYHTTAAAAAEAASNVQQHHQHHKQQQQQSMVRMWAQSLLHFS